MHNLTFRNLWAFSKSLACAGLTLGLFIPSPNANASALKQLADANNAVYRQSRDLGRYATPGKLSEIQHKNFGPALAALASEHYEKYQSWKRAMKNAMTESKSEIARILGKSGAEEPGKGSGSGSEPKPLIGRAGTDASTGVQGGQGGAKETAFGGKRAKEVHKTVEEGISAD